MPKAPVQYGDKFYAIDCIHSGEDDNKVEKSELIFSNEATAFGVFNYLWANLGPVTEENIDGIVEEWRKRHAKNN
jgi:hypothetical protein